MKFEINRKEFLKDWQLAEGFVDAKMSVNGILLTAKDNKITLKASDMKTSMQCVTNGVNVLEAGEVVLPASIFGGLLRKSASDELVLEVNSSRGILKSGYNKTQFTVIPIENFPHIPDINSAQEVCEVVGTDLAKCILEGCSAASQPSDFPRYMGACNLKIDNNFIEAASTDGKRLAISKVACSAMNRADDLLVVASTLLKISKTFTADSVKIFADNSVVWFNLRNINFSVRRIEGSFPMYNKLLNSEKQTILQISCDTLLEALDRVDIIAKTTIAHIMCITLNPEGEVKIVAQAPEIGTTREILQANVQGDYMLTGFNVKYFMDGLKVIGSHDVVIEFSSVEGQTRMTRNDDNSFLYMLMPSRLTEQDKLEYEGDTD